MVYILFPFFYNSCRIPSNYLIVIDIFRYDRSCSDDSTITYVFTTVDDYALTYPAIVTNSYFLFFDHVCPEDT